MVLGVALTQSCSEEIDKSSRYTFTGNTIISYLEEYPETYSEYSALLNIVPVSDFSDSKVSQLLSARGNYTCFAPTNEAIHDYLAHLVDSGIISDSSWTAPEFLEINPETGKQDLLIEIQKNIVLNSLIDGGDEIEAYQTSDFSERAEMNQMLGLANMMNRKLQVTAGSNTKYAISGSDVSDTNCNIFTINGRIHQVDKVIAPSTQTASQLFEKIVAIIRIAVPYTGMIISTRESAATRKKVLELGISQISGGSRTSVGGYATPEIPEENSAQFDISDTRTLDEVVNWLLDLKHLPSFCTACYRLGRTGDRFMSLVKTGQIANCCAPNALMTLKEYLQDYASPDTYAKGIKLIEEEIQHIPNPKIKEIAMRNLKEIEEGKRDFRF